MEQKNQTSGIAVFSRMDSGLAYIEVAVMGLSMTAMVLNTIANVLGRYLFSQSLYFSEELNEILMVTVTFVGLSYVTRKGRHIRMSALSDMLPEQPRRWLMTLIAATTAAMMFLLAWEAWEYVAKVASRERITPVMQIPLWWTYVPVVVGLALTGVQFGLAAFANLVCKEGVWIALHETDDYDDPELAALLELQKSSRASAPLDAR